ncbi:LLM class flavin-dependent oxidoreductase [Nocardia sp. NBC_01503]|uniref:LLM class flavin-dependent oxidoreductase n=1 Tax=Nocardia sp. NBC_01503 TaxID=2975997 RepID=UPI002E7B2DA1|nr:LLM class flavin-dependent oxidoreductase [Nocardia sp. NBC_01503]WTL34354.1 LLM class flavin-dependent oxidoreductase [Nocardia sp. NBC_01503]
MSMNFGIAHVPRSGSEWVRTAQSAEQQGYGTLLLPDTLYTPSPFPALAAAAAVTTTLHLRPNVIAAPLRTPAVIARETSALQLLSDGRFELGLGTGRPDAAREAEKLGVAWGSAAERRRGLIETIETVRATVRPTPPIIIAAAGPKALVTAADHADRVHLAVDPAATESDLAALVAIVRDHTDRPVAFTLQLVGVGDRIPQYMAAHLGIDPAALRAAGAAALLPADPAAAAESLTHLDEKHGIDELIVPGELAEAFAPILARLS